MAQLEELLARMKCCYRDAASVATLPRDSDDDRRRAHGASSSSGGTAAAARPTASADDCRQCFAEVPSLFFKKEFFLGDPDVFEHTLGTHSTLAAGAHHQHQKRPGRGNGSGAGSGGAVGQYEPQQEVLSRHLDLVEVALLKTINSRSPAFFRALDDIQGQQKQVAEAAACLARLRARLQVPPHSPP